MNLVQTTLAVIGILALIESVWGVSAPAGVKRMVKWFVDNVAEKQKLLGFVLCGVGLILVVIVLIGAALSTWIVLLTALLLAWLGLLCFRPNALKNFLTAWIINRTPGFVRSLYILEFVVAVAMIWIAFAKL